jgi:hypothetical protein
MGNDEQGNWRGFGYESNSDYWQRTNMEQDAARRYAKNNPSSNNGGLIGALLGLVFTIVFGVLKFIVTSIFGKRK